MVIPSCEDELRESLPGQMRDNVLMEGYGVSQGTFRIPRSRRLPLTNPLGKAKEIQFRRFSLQVPCREGLKELNVCGDVAFYLESLLVQY